MDYKQIIGKAIEIAAHLYGVKQEDIVSPSRKEIFVHCRACVYYAVTYGSKNIRYREIHDLISRDQSSVQNAIQNIYRLQKMNAKHRSKPQEVLLENAETTRVLLFNFIKSKG